MTGPLERLRSWLGARVSGADDAPTGTDAGDGTDAAAGGRDRTVVHRDDRPLETPTATSPAADRTVERRRERSPPIPDAEAVAGGSTAEASVPAESERGGAGAAGGAAASTPTTDGRDDAEPGRSGGTETDHEGGGDPAASFACSVCGTVVDDPTAACPLCRSTDVGPAPEATTGDDGSTRAGRTTVTSTGDEEAAVARLRDVAADDDGDESAG